MRMRGVNGAKSDLAHAYLLAERLAAGATSADDVERQTCFADQLPHLIDERADPVVLGVGHHAHELQTRKPVDEMGELEGFLGGLHTTAVVARVHFDDHPHATAIGRCLS